MNNIFKSIYTIYKECKSCIFISVCMCTFLAMYIHFSTVTNVTLIWCKNSTKLSYCRGLESQYIACIYF